MGELIRTAVALAALFATVAFSSLVMVATDSVAAAGSAVVTERVAMLEQAVDNLARRTVERDIRKAHIETPEPHRSRVQGDAR